MGDVCAQVCSEFGVAEKTGFPEALIAEMLDDPSERGIRVSDAELARLLGEAPAPRRSREVFLSGLPAAVDEAALRAERLLRGGQTWFILDPPGRSTADRHRVDAGSTPNQPLESTPNRATKATSSQPRIERPNRHLIEPGSTSSRPRSDLESGLKSTPTRPRSVL